MKTRNGFVSNSSSSSFIVKYYDSLDVVFGPKSTSKCKKALTKSEVKKLEEFGFEQTWARHPSLIVCSDFMSPKSKFRDFSKDLKSEDDKPYAVFYGFEVSCNQYEPLQFLLKNKISFVASIHYGHETYIYNKENPYVMVFTNYGLQVETYLYDKSWEQIIGKDSEDNCGGLGNQKPYYKIPVKDILEDKYEN
jgi:hypothetical protein